VTSGLISILRQMRAAELVRLKVDIIFAADGTAATLAARQATSVIPIVFPISGDPVTSGLVASLGRAGGNVTGLSILASDLAGKRLELSRELVSSLRRLAILVNVNSPNAVLEMGEVQAAARILGLEVAKCEIRQAEDIAPAVEALKNRARPRSCRIQQSGSHQHPSAGRTTADDLRLS
jgi:putative ABC transport system substrate-binding protein